MCRASVGILAVASLALSACGGGSDGGTIDLPVNPPPGGGGTPGPAGQLGFSSTQLTINESAGTATVMVTRVGGSSGAVSVVVLSAEITAKPDQDFTTLNTTVRFADGDSTPKPIQIAITNDTTAESDESFFFAFLNPTGGATISNSAKYAFFTINDDDEPGAARLSIGYEVKRLAFAWIAPASATSYKLLRRENPTSDFVQVGADLAATVTSTKVEIPVHLYKWDTDVPDYRVDSCNSGICTPSNVVTTIRVASALAAGYVKASDTGAGARFGSSVAVSGDGKTVAIGAPFANAEAGSVYVYLAPIAGGPVLAPRPLKIPAPSTQAMHFGFAVALSEDGNTLAVGAPYDSHLQSGVGTYPVTPNANSTHSGGVFVYSRVGGVWSTTPVYIKAIDVDATDEFGSALAVKGGILVIGAPRQDSPTDGIDTTNSAVDSGAAYAFYANAGTWAQSPRILKADNIGNGDLFGTSVAVSNAGSIIVVGAPGEDGDGRLDSGAAYRFVKSEGDGVPAWNPPLRFKAANSGAGDLYGSSVAVSANGEVLAVGAPSETGDEGNDVGAVYAYTMAQGGIIDVARLQASHRFSGARYGSSIAINADGTILAAGSPTESVNEIGVDGGVNAPGTAPSSGAVDVLVRQAGSSWSSQGSTAPTPHYIKSNTAGAGDLFGGAVTLSADGNTLVVGANGEDGNGTNIDSNNNPADNSLADSGAAFLY